jgi:type II secretory pathway component PulK
MQRDAHQYATKWRAEAPPSKRNERGSVILFVLGLVLLTALLLTQFIARAHSELLTEARRSQQEPLRDEAYSALQVTLAVLADIQSADNGLHAPSQGWGTPLDYAEYEAPAGLKNTVTVEDLSGRLSLAGPDLDGTTLVNLLVEIGCLSSDAERIVDGILAWTRPDYTAQYADYATIPELGRAPTLIPPHRPLQSFDELRLIPIVSEVLCDENGDWNELGVKFLSCVNLHPNRQPNLNTAPPEVLAALGLDADRVLGAREPLVRDEPKVFYSLGDVGVPLGQSPGSTAPGVDATQFRINIITAAGGRKFHLTADVQVGGGETSVAGTATPETSTSEPRPWTRNSIDSAFRILEIQENRE